MENKNENKFEDDFNCEGGIWGKSTPCLKDNKKFDVTNENGEEESYSEPHCDYEQEIPYDYEWESYTETH